MNWDLPGRASTYAGQIDAMFWVIAAITGLLFVIVEAGLLYFLVKYRARPGRRAAYIEGSTRAEVVWTALPALILVALAVASARVWAKVKDPRNFPANAVPVRVEAKQFEWNVTYPGPDGALGTADDFTKRNDLRVPVGRPVLVHLAAQDVIHSFFVPEFRIKQDAVPGMEIPVWFEATETGEFELACAELCGLGHYRMRGTVRVLTPEAFEAWMAAGGPEAGTE
jgi:cytochrome c oxidase subunit 2